MLIYNIKMWIYAPDFLEVNTDYHKSIFSNNLFSILPKILLNKIKPVL